MFLRLVLLFTLLPILELYLLIEIGAVIGGFNTILIVLSTGVFGAWLAQQEGLRALQRVQSELNAGRMPTDALVDGVLILVAGVVMLAPGLITDAAGLLLLIPPSRAVVRRWLAERFRRMGPPGGATIIAVDGWREP